jgi:hypothetical protein
MTEDTDKDLSLLFQLMGMALTTWQGVEDAHYLFFLKILGAPKEEICSVLYFSPPTFESRRVMADRVAEHALGKTEDKKEWPKISKRLETGASHRGRVAHYALDFEFIWDSTVATLAQLTVGQPHLRPSRYNKLKAAKDQLTTKQISGYVLEFNKLRADVTNFTKRILLPEPRQGVGLLSGLGPPRGAPGRAHRTLAGGYLNSDPTDKPPSDR